MPFPFIETLVRLLIPLSIFKWPLFGIILSTLSDMYDWKFVKVKTAADLALYQRWDKAMDLYYQTIILLALLRFQDTLFKKTAIVLYAIRMVGDSIFFVTQDRIYLLFFPNIFENFVIFYLVYRWFSKEKVLFHKKQTLLLVLFVITIPKLIHEYFLHFLLIQPWDFYNVGRNLDLQGFFEEYSNYFVWGSVLYILPMGITLLYLLRKRS